jgi:hypothetical protein
VVDIIASEGRRIDLKEYGGVWFDSVTSLEEG